MPLLDHNTNREATSFLLKKYNDFSHGAGPVRIVKMECSPFMFEQYKDEMTPMYRDGFYELRFIDMTETCNPGPALNFKAAKLTPNPELENHEVTITFMSETKVKI